MNALQVFLFLMVPVLSAYPAALETRGHIEGRIVDAVTLQPMAGAEVEVVGHTRRTTANAAGVYRIEDLGEGVYQLEVRSMGYAAHRATDVVVVRGKTTYVPEIGLGPVPMALEAIAVATEVAVAGASRHSFQREEIRRMPGGAGDVVRAMGTLPGVSTSEGELSAMTVRGGGVDDNLILIDNIPLAKINHFEGGSDEQEVQGGRFSIFTAGLVERATFYGGGFGVEHGRKGASVLDLSLREGNMVSPTVSGSYDLLGLELSYDGPAYPLGTTSLLVNYRTFDLINALEIAGEKGFGDPVMSDLVVKTTTHLNSANTISVLGIHAADRLIRAPRHVMGGGNLADNAIWDIDESRWVAGVNWRFLISDKSVLRSTVYVRGNVRDRMIGHVTADGFGETLPPTLDGLSVREAVRVQSEREREAGWRSQFLRAVGERAVLRVGADVYTSHLDYALTQNGADTLYHYTPGAVQEDPDQRFLIIRPEQSEYHFEDRAVNLALYAAYELNAGRLTLDPGLRYSRSGFSGRNALDPRLRLRYRLSGGTAFTLATGIYHQTPLNRHVVADPDNRSLRDERSVHLIGGVTHPLGDDLTATVEAYYKRLDGLATPASAVGGALTSTGTGWATGFDAIVRRRLAARFHGEVTYSFLVSRRNDNDGMGEYDAPYSQPHNFAARFGYEMNDRWFFSSKFRYAAGRAKDRVIVHENVLGDGDRMRYSREVVARNADRVPDFHLLNVRVDYRRRLGPVALVTFLDLENIYNRFNTYEERFSALTGKERAIGFSFLGNAGFKLEL
jgi:hypothetical protein